jgi:hypothetical protein
MEKENAIIVHDVLERFRFTHPVDAAARKQINASRTRVLKRSLKGLGIASLWYTVVTFILLKSRGFGFKLTLFACKTAALASFALFLSTTAGIAYVAINYFSVETADPIKTKEETPAKENKDTTNAAKPANDTVHVQKEATLIYDILLYNGRTYRGSIISRGANYRVLTSRGEVLIPAGEIQKLQQVE